MGGCEGTGAGDSRRWRRGGTRDCRWKVDVPGAFDFDRTTGDALGRSVTGEATPRIIGPVRGGVRPPVVCWQCCWCARGLSG